MATDKNMSTAKVSIIIPVYNAELTLKRCLDSLVEQTYENLEIICVNDGSQDSSDKILQIMSMRDSRIKVINQKNKGPAAARNAALDVATGEYVAFVDSDDFVDSQTYQRLIEIAEKNLADIVVYGGNTFPDSPPEWITEKLASTDKIYVSEDENVGMRVLFEEPSSRPFIWLHFIKRALLEKPYKLRFNESFILGEDQLFQFEYFPRAKTIAFISDKLYNYCWHHENSIMWVTSRQPITKFCTHLDLVDEVIGKFLSNGYEKYSDKVLSWAVDFLYYDFIKLPAYLQHRYSARIINFFKRMGLIYAMIDANKIPWAKEMFAAAEISTSATNAIAELRQDIAHADAQINETLQSRTYRIGRLLTPRKKRIKLPLDII